ncbi:uncharacterized protein CEXT_428881 [Caerostris extrusa]|uniref:Uncharacterized protein n=1 Tax=Caerostris extrusa TaxID=172846 RepID=A0AAV4MJR7_CAEEX|nr:uncharacterized protein CEXT_428881 [Caerostris extrusa]
MHHQLMIQLAHINLYDRINTRSYSPIKCPPSDALERAKEVLAEIETWPDDTDPDVQELRDIFVRPPLSGKLLFSVIRVLKTDELTTELAKPHAATTW